MTVELTFIGKRLKVYNGVDEGVAIHLKAGDRIGVSDAKAEKLLADFPTEFQKTSGPRETEPVERELTDAPPVEEPTGKVPAKNKMAAPKKSKRK